MNRKPRYRSLWWVGVAGGIVVAGSGGAAGYELAEIAGETAVTNAIPEGIRHPFVVRRFEFVGNRVFSDARLGAVVADYLWRPMDILELEQARLAITKLYIENGYVNSGAIVENLPDTEGVVAIRIVEGELTQANIEGVKWVREGFYRSRLGVGSGRPLSSDSLRQELRLWRQQYPVEQVNAELRPGALPGQAVIDVAIRERFPYHLGVQYANDRPPSTGSDRISVALEVESLTRNADRLHIDYGIVRGGRWVEDAEWQGWDDLAVSYRIPVNSRDTSLSAWYSRYHVAVTEEAFRELHITAESESFGVSLSHPVIRSPSRELTLSLAGERRVNRNFLLGRPYSFSPGSIEGESVVHALRLSGQWVQRGARQVIAGRLTLSWGIDALGATRNSGALPDGQFVGILGQARYLRRIGRTPHQWAVKLAGQYTPDPLLTLEQLAMGGGDTVRGYRENTLIRDYGAMATLEAHLAVWTRKDAQPIVRLVPFASLGAGWNNDRSTPHPSDIESAGVGMVVTPIRQIEASLFWGYAFRELEYTTYNLQDDGIHFRLSVWAF